MVKTKTKSKPSGKKATAITGCRYIGTEDLPVDTVLPSPYQPRLAIDDGELGELAGVIAKAGFLDAVWVRETDPPSKEQCIPARRWFELLDGERRWRAAKLAGLKTIRSDVFHASDSQARQMAMLSVVHREDLGPIERATAYQQMLSAGDYPDQKSLAEALGIDSSTLSNLLRLLKLPEAWRRRIISREMSERHARALLPFIKYPTILAAFDEFFVQNLDLAENRRELPTAAEWEEETVPRIVKDATRTMDGLHGDRMYFHPRWGRVSIFEPTVDQEKALKIIKLGDEELATNVELWEELQKAHLEREKGRKQRSEVRDQEDDQADSSPEAVSADDAEEGEDGQIAQDGDEVPEDLHDAYSDPRGLDRPTAESLCAKLLDVYDRHLRGEIKLARPGIEFCQEMQRVGYVGLMDRNSADKAVNLVEEYWKAPKDEKENGSAPRPPLPAPCSDFYRWKLAWMRKLVAEELSHQDVATLAKILTLGLCVWKIPQQGLDTILDEALRSEADPSRRKTLAENVMNTGDYHLEDVLAYVVADWFWSEKEGPRGDVPAEDIETLVDQLELDLENEWQKGNVLAPRALLDLFGDARLHELGKKWKVKMEVTWQRPRLLDALENAIITESAEEPSLPAEVAKAKRG